MVRIRHRAGFMAMVAKEGDQEAPEIVSPEPPPLRSLRPQSNLLRHINDLSTVCQEHSLAALTGHNIVS